MHTYLLLISIVVISIIASLQCNICMLLWISTIFTLNFFRFFCLPRVQFDHVLPALPMTLQWYIGLDFIVINFLSYFADEYGGMHYVQENEDGMSWLISHIYIYSSEPKFWSNYWPNIIRKPSKVSQPSFPVLCSYLLSADFGNWTKN